MGTNREDNCKELEDCIVEMHRQLLELMQDFQENGGHICSPVIDLKTRKSRKEKFKESAKKFIENADHFKETVMRC